jgi:hypothetical protein
MTKIQNLNKKTDSISRLSQSMIFFDRKWQVLYPCIKKEAKNIDQNTPKKLD